MNDSQESDNTDLLLKRGSEVRDLILRMSDVREFKLTLQGRVTF